MDLAAGGEPQLAYRPPGGALLGPLWSPDGGEVVVYQLDGQVTFLDPATGSVRNAAHSCTAPAWSPGGDRLICRSSDGDTFDLIDAETGALRGSVPRPATALLPQWSPVSDEIVYATLDGDATAIWRRSLEGGLPVELAADSLENYAPAWSPDGQWIAYQSRLNSANSEIWVMDRNGENARRLTNSPAASWSRAPYWSPDGRWLTFVSNREGGVVAEYGDVFAVSVETGEVQQVTRTGGRVYNWRVSWSR
jgi:TolB protein